MELRLIRYFIAVAQELNFSRAADRLNMAQPPLSQQIKKLEEELGVPLFNRTKRHVELTIAGKVFLEQAYQIFTAVDKACDMAQKTHRGEVGQLVLGFAGIATFDILPKLMHSYRTKYPMVEVTLLQLGTTEQVQALLKEKIHIGILCLPVAATELNFEIIQRDHYVVALPQSHSLALQVMPIELKDLSQEAFIMTTRRVGEGYYDGIIKLCNHAGFRPNITQEVNELQTTVSLIAANMGIALVPSSMQKFRMPGVVYKQLGNRIPALETALAWRKNEESPTVRALVDLARRDFLLPRKIN